jgi:nicotinamidase-related amidase
LQLRRRKINTIVLRGVSTSIGVETIGREACQRGYNQFFAIDAMTAAVERRAENFIFPRIGIVRITGQVLKIID